jgi:hypothetical protein
MIQDRPLTAGRALGRYSTSVARIGAGSVLRWLCRADVAESITGAELQGPVSVCVRLITRGAPLHDPGR